MLKRGKKFQSNKTVKKKKINLNLIMKNLMKKKKVFKET